MFVLFKQRQSDGSLLARRFQSDSQLPFRYQVVSPDSLPASCRDVGLIYAAENLTPMQCLMQAPPQMAKWVGEHPGWKIMMGSCRRAGRYAKT